MTEYLIEHLRGLEPKVILRELKNVRLIVIYDMMDVLSADSIYDLAERLSVA